MNQEIISRLPSHIYSGDSFEQMAYRPIKEALTRKYIRLNSKNRQAFLTFDVDTPCAGASWIDGGLLEPTFTVINPRNGHAHITYAFKSPVATSEHAHVKPLLYVAAIENAYIERLGADYCYCGLITKNPWSDSWYTVDTGNTAPVLYELSELASCVDLSRPSARIIENAIGRNCQLFDSLRVWAYIAIRDYWQDDSAWFEAVYAEAVRLNIFIEQLPPSEVRTIARSVAKHVLLNFTPQKLQELIKRTHTPELQKARRAKRTEKQNVLKVEGLKLLSEGASIKDVINALNVNRSTIYRWTKKAL